jgi:CRP-like cAMP-binding protein
MANQTMDIVSKHLAGTDLFGGLPQHYIDRLSSACRLQRFKKRSFLFYQDDQGESAYLLIQGRIKLFRHSESGKEIVIKTVKPTEFFAEVILFEVRVYPVTAEALVDSRCIEINRRAFQRLIADTEFRNRFIGLLMARQRYLASRIQYLTTYDLEERFFRFLDDQYGQKQEIRNVIAKKDLAAAIGATPESLSRMVRRLTDQGRVSWKGNTIQRRL